MLERCVFYTSEDLKPHPKGVAMIQTVTDNLLEISSAMRIEIFNGVNVSFNYKKI
jgi:hypothetical protein